MSPDYLSALDIGYRLWMKDAEYREWDSVTRLYTSRYVSYWFEHYSSYGGVRGVWDDIESVKRSARANGIKKGTYEIWKFHIGLPTSSVPWFPPEKVYE